jgi:hypothetical protein
VCLVHGCDEGNEQILLPRWIILHVLAVVGGASEQDVRVVVS